MAQKNDFEVAAERLKAAADDITLLASVCEEKEVRSLLNHPQVGEGWRKWVEWRRKVLSSIPPEAPSVPEEEQVFSEAPTSDSEKEEEEDKASPEQAEVPEEMDVLIIAKEAAKKRQELAEVRKRAYDQIVAAAKAAGVFIDPDEEIDVGGRIMRSFPYLINLLTGGATPEEVVREARALGWAHPFAGASPEAYNALLQAAQEAGLWLLKRVIVADRGEVRPIVELARKIEAGLISASAAVELAREAGWTRPLRQMVPEETTLNGGGLATIEEQLLAARRRQKEAMEAQQNAGRKKKKK